MFELLGHGLFTVVQLKYLLPLFFRHAGIGVVGGALPGVTITMTIIVVLPFTFGLDPLQGLSAMTGVYVGGSAGGLVTCLPARHPGHAFGDRDNVRRLPDGAQWRTGPRASGSASGPRSSAACSAACS